MRTRRNPQSIDTFLSPESMLAPGVAGSLVMMITNGLAINLQLADQERTYTGLAISFLVGVLILVSARQIWLRAVYYVLNSLIIFVVAFGSANLISKTTQPLQGTWLQFVSPAYAQTTGDGHLSTCDYLKKSRADAEKRNDTKAVADLNEIITRNCPSDTSTKKTYQFFAPWK